MMIESLIADREVLYFIKQAGCAACDVAEPLLADFERKHPNVMVLKLEAGGPFPERLGITIKATPTYVFRRGQEARIKAGIMKVSDLEKWLKSMGATL